MLGEVLERGLEGLNQGELAKNKEARNKVILFGMECALGRKPTTVLPTGGSLDPISIKQTTTAVAALFLESARRGADSESLKMTFTEEDSGGVGSSLGAAVIDELVDVYSKGFDRLRGVACDAVRAGVTINKVRDVNWRLDLVVESASDQSRKAPPQPMFLVRLNTYQPQSITQQDGSSAAAAATTKPVEFSCSMEEMQDLVHKLRDAAKQIERSVANFQK